MLRVGEAVGRYVVEGVVGQGGMGCVYRALDPSLGRRVALKVLVTDATDAGSRAEAAARMSREARAAAAFMHPNVVAIHDVGEIDGAPFIAMELVSGSTLRELIGKPEITTQQKLAWLVDIARGLAAAHRAGLVHRDIKPENVMVTSDGLVKILDFGIARRADIDRVDGAAPTEVAQLAPMTAEGLVIGTPQYMSPEQLRAAPLDGRCDQYAWGVTAYELLAGELPWRGKTGAMLVAAILDGEVASLGRRVPGLDERVSDVVARAMQIDRARRFPSMAELIQALAPDASSARQATPVVVRTGDAVDAGAATTAQPMALTTAHAGPSAAQNRSRLAMVGLGVVLLAAAGVLGSRFGATRQGPSRAEPLADVAMIGPLPADRSEDPPFPWSPPADGTLHMWSSAKDHGHRHNDLRRFCQPFVDYETKNLKRYDLDAAYAVWTATPTTGLPEAQVEFCKSPRTVAFGREELLLDSVMPEAVNTLLQIAASAGRVVTERRAHGETPFCPPGRRIPAELPAPGAQGEVKASDFTDDPGWSCLGVHTSGLSAFQYWYETTPTSFTAFARGLFPVDGHMWRATGSIQGTLVHDEFEAATEVDVRWETVK